MSSQGLHLLFFEQPIFLSPQYLTSFCSWTCFSLSLISWLVILGTDDDDAPPRDAAAFALTWANVAAKSKFNGADSCSVEDAAVEEVCDEDDCSACFSFSLV